MSLKDFKFLAALLWLLCFSSAVFANVGDSFGFGSRAAGTSNALVSDPDFSYSAYTNPAKLGAMGDRRFSFGYGIIAMQNDFIPISNVVTQNTSVSDQQTSSNVEEDYKLVLGQEIGMSFQLFPKFHHIGVGLVLYAPLQHLLYFDSGETYVPEYILYRSRNQRPQFEFGTGGEITEGLTFGAGLHMGYTFTSRANAFMQFNGSKPSTMRFGVTTKPHLSPVAALRFQRGDFGSGLVVRFPNASKHEVLIDPSVRALGNLAAIDFNFNASAALYYDPLSIELGSFYQYKSISKLLFEIDFQRWSQFQTPNYSIDSANSSNCEGAGCGVSVNSSHMPEHPYKDIFIPKIAHEYLWGSKMIRAGYSYHPSILGPENTSGDANYLDPPKHILSAGLGTQWEHCLSTTDTCHLDFHASYQKLVTQDVNKSSSSNIGAPGYQAGGKIWGGGVSLSLDL